MNSLLLPNLPRARSLLFGGCATLLAVSSLAAQTGYTVVDLSATASPYGAAYAASSGQAAGVASSSPEYYQGVAAVPSLRYPHATLWTGDGASDLHPVSLLGGETANSVSTVLGFAGGVQVGWGSGPNTQGLNVPLLWHDTAASARVLALPAGSTNAQALATDGTQIAGLATVVSRGASSFHALLWNALTGAVTDLGDGRVLGVSHGQQAGYTNQSKGSAATIWSGTGKSAVVIHPKSADASQAYATDGLHQAGFSSVTVKVPGEKGKGGTTKTVSIPTAWSGTAASAVFLPTYPYQMGFATGVSGSRVVGYAYDGDAFGAPAAYHAVIWNTNSPGVEVTDLNTYLPAGYTGAMANAIDAQGNIAGTLFTAEGQQHAAVWLPNL